MQWRRIPYGEPGNPERRQPPLSPDCQRPLLWSQDDIGAVWDCIQGHGLSGYTEGLLHMDMPQAFQG